MIRERKGQDIGSTIWILNKGGSRKGRMTLTQGESLQQVDRRDPGHLQKTTTKTVTVEIV